LEIADYLHNNRRENIIDSADLNTRDPERYPGATIDNFYGIRGKSREIRDVLDLVKLVAPAETSVLILGESGTGKERIAECIHELSQRASRPLIKVNCAALPAPMIESILFGHEKGSFTGATEKRIGKFEQAHRGTIFLDEIGEMSADLQVKLLRALQEKEIERLGGSHTLKIDARVIAATNRNLDTEVAEGRFRMDLYYRLNVFPVVIPPLRERLEDIPLLVRHFVTMFSKKLGKPLQNVSDSCIEQLQNYYWPGNVRELQHVIERAVLLNKDATIRQVSLPTTQIQTSLAESRMKTIEENERDYIIQVIKKCQGKISGKGGAAEVLGINVSTLNSRMKKLGITKSLNIL
jgi:two-component system, NtrC family, response regulator HydG